VTDDTAFEELDAERVSRYINGFIIPIIRIIKIAATTKPLFFRVCLRVNR
jgi:hypothetical protein